MGCLCFKGRGNQEDGIEEININVTNSAVTCKPGFKGSKVQVQQTENFSYKVSGSGILLGSCPLDADTARWEVVLGSDTANIQVGIMRYRQKEASKILEDDLAKHESSADNNTAWRLSTQQPLKKGDVIGIFWDQTDLPMLSFSINGELVSQASVNRIRPSTEIFPAISLSGNAEAELIFDERAFKCPAISTKFKMIICSTSII